MGAYCVGCSTTPFKGNAGCRSTSAPTMIRSIASHQWQANLRILEVKEIKTVPYLPLPHPFVERLIGTLRLSARLDRNLTVGTYIRRQWLRDFQKTLDRCDIRSNSTRLPRNHSVFLRRHSAAPINSLFTATSCVPELRRSSLSQRDCRQNCPPYNNSPDTALDRCVIRSTLGKLPTKPSGVCVLGRCALRGSDRFSSTVSIRQGQVVGDLYSQLESNIQFRKEVIERVGLGFTLPSKNAVV